MNIRTVIFTGMLIFAQSTFTAPDEPPISTAPLLPGTNRSTGQTGVQSLDQRGVYGESMISILCCCFYLPYRLCLLRCKGDQE